MFEQGNTVNVFHSKGEGIGGVDLLLTIEIFETPG
ncbi:hypothetical protein BvCmsKKP005_03468 [Escherichia coli]|nr:hypothetical protein BvCmsKKP005_03468 [Escherichia coli]GEE65424.1 hypothetical protein EC132418_02790 [Escherichia coli O145:H28]